MQEEIGVLEVFDLNLLKRVISATVLIAIVVGAVLLGRIATVVLGCVVAFFMMLDVSGALKAGKYNVNRPILLISSLLIFPAVYFKSFEGAFLLAVLTFTALAIAVIFSKKIDVNGLIGGGFLLIYPFMPSAMLVYLLSKDINLTGSRIGMLLCVGTVACAALADTFAYFFGMLFGKKKLCPNISPKKTVVGSVAAFFGGAVGGIVMFLFLRNTLPLIHWYDWAIIGVACGGFSQIGDLTASLIKRHCNIKDYGKYIPGHGGIMDRMDSISVCLVATVIYVKVFIPELL